ncbi:MAG: hypothetical protein ACREEM_34025 [Blastocatellia bacterium]
MSQEITKDLTMDEKMDLILSEMRLMKVEMGEMKGRMSSLEAKVEERLLDTRPIWQAIHTQTEMLVEKVGRLEDSNLRVEEQLKTIHHQLEEMTLDVMEVRTAQRELRKRVTALEQQPA